jgi:hypothetical protein
MAGDQVVDFEAILDQAKPLFKRLAVAAVDCHSVPPCCEKRPTLPEGTHRSG